MTYETDNVKFLLSCYTKDIKKTCLVKNGNDSFSIDPKIEKKDSISIDTIKFIYIDEEKFIFLSSPDLMPFKKSQFLSKFLFLFLPINQLKRTLEAVGRAEDHNVIDDVDSRIGLAAFMTKLTSLAITHYYI